MVTNANAPSAFQTLFDEVLDCSRCRRRSDRPGYYPKFGGGSSARPHTFIVSKNPGRPRKEECRYTRADADFILDLLDGGTQIWLKQITGGRFPDALRASRLSWDEDLYCTEAVKCQRDPKGVTVAFDDAFRECKPHLARELALLRPRHIITLGREALDAVSLVIGVNSPNVKATQWWKSESLAGIPAGKFTLYPLFLTTAQRAGWVANPLDLGKAFGKVFALIAQSENSHAST